MYDSQIVHHNHCFNLLILHNNSFDNQGSEINKNDIFLRFDKLSFTKRCVTRFRAKQLRTAFQRLAKTTF